PDDATLFEGDDHGAKEREGEDESAEGEEESVPGRYTGMTAEHAVGAGDCDESEDGGNSSGSVEEADGGRHAEDEEPEAAEECERDVEAEGGPEVFGHDRDEAVDA